MTYEPISPETVGRKRQFHLGKFIGRHFVEYLLKMGGIKASKEEARKITEQVKKTHEDLKKKQSLESFDRIKEDLKELRTGVSEYNFWEIAFDVLEE